jgi:hypothetical protein
MGDVKELIPEFYYLDDMFINSGCLPLGTRQNGEVVSNVVSVSSIESSFSHSYSHAPGSASLGGRRCS